MNWMKTGKFEKFFSGTMRKKKIALILVAEIIFLIVAGLLYSRKDPVQIVYTQEDLYFSNEKPGFYLDNSNPDRYIATPQFSLPKGTYIIDVTYEKKGAAKVWTVYRDERFRNNISGDVNMGEEGRVTFEIQVSYADRPIQVRMKGEGDSESGEYLLIRKIAIEDSPLALRYSLFKIAAFVGVLDMCLLLYMNRGKLWPSGERRVLTGSLVILILLNSLPLMVDYLPDASHDLGFHLMRIEGIKSGLEQGMFPVKIQPNLLRGYGYATSVFYGDIFLYIPAVLRLFGVSVQNAYQFYIFLVNVATVLGAYFCFSKMSNKKIGVVCATVYSLNLYRLSCIYTRAAVGEYTAMIFLPFILYGIWNLYQKAEKGENDNKSWKVIAFGCTGIAMCHMISCITVAFFALFSGLVLWKKTFTRRIFFPLIKAFFLLIGLTLWFFVPMLDYMMNGVYGINSEESYIPYALEDGAASVAQIFLGAFQAVGTSFAYESGMAGEMPLTPGAGAIAVLVLCVFFYLKYGMNAEKKEVVKETFFCLVLSSLSLFLATGLIPYTKLAEKFKILEFPERAIQYPWRFLAIAAVLFAWLTCLFLKKELGYRKEIIAAGILCIALWQGTAYMSEFLSESGAFHIYQEGNLSTMEISNREYLPVEAEIEEFSEKLEYATDVVEVFDWKRVDSAIEMEVKNISLEEQRILVPLLYYKGYKASDGEGIQLTVCQGDYGKVEVRIPGNYEGKIAVYFQEPWYWRLCEGLSLLCLTGTFVGNKVCRDYRRKRIML